MKKNNLWMLAAILFSSLVAISFTACSRDDVDDDDEVETIIDYSKSMNMPWEQYGAENITIVDSGTIAFRDVCQNTIAHETAQNDDADTILVNYAKFLIDSIARYEQHVNDSLQAVSGENSLLDYVLALKWYTFTYPSVSVTGEPINLSALFVYPYELKSKRLTNYYIGTHVTITSNSQCPSNFTKNNFASDVGMLAIFAHILFNHGYVVIPDYEGYGETKGRPHPYLNREVTAKQVIDGAKAGMMHIQHLANLDKDMQLHEKWKAVSVGYSQGGATAAATYRYAQEHPDECSSLRMAGAVCGDGPYDPVATLNNYISEGKVFMPVAVALMLKGMCDTDPDMRSLGCRVEDFCTPGFVNTGIFNSIANKTKTTDDIAKDLLDYSYNHDDFHMTRILEKEGHIQIEEYTKMNYELKGVPQGMTWLGGVRNTWCNIDQMLNEECIAFFKTGAVKDNTMRKKFRALSKCMKRNRLFYGTNGDWLPPSRSKFTFFHSKTDEVVPHVNMTSVRDVWGPNAACYIGFEFKSNWLQKALAKLSDKAAAPLKKDWGTHVQCGTLLFLGKSRDLADKITGPGWVGGEYNDEDLGALTYIASMFADI